MARRTFRQTFNGPGMLMVFSLLNLGDALTTVMFLGMGLQEADPTVVALFRFGTTGLLIWLGIKFAVSGGAAWLARYLRSRWTTVWIAVVVWLYLVAFISSVYLTWAVVGNSVGMLIHLRILP